MEKSSIVFITRETSRKQIHSVTTQPCLYTVSKQTYRPMTAHVLSSMFYKQKLNTRIVREISSVFDAVFTSVKRDTVISLCKTDTVGNDPNCPS